MSNEEEQQDINELEQWAKEVEKIREAELIKDLTKTEIEIEVRDAERRAEMSRLKEETKYNVIFTRHDEDMVRTVLSGLLTPGGVENTMKDLKFSGKIDYENIGLKIEKVEE